MKGLKNIMNMSNNEKDEFIRKTLAADKNIASGAELKEKIKRDIDISKIKLKKHTLGERRFIKFLGVLLVVSVASNAYLIRSRTFSKPSDSEVDPVKSVAIKDDIENVEKPISNLENTVKEIKNTTKTELVIEEAVKNHKELNEEKLTEELERYAFTIGRLEEDALEKNTILLIIANNYFSSQATQSTGLEISSNAKFAMTADNVHLFLKEMMGIEVSSFLETYTDYIKYNSGSEFYLSGQKSTSLSSEKYEISNLKIINSVNGEYTLKGDIKKSSTIEVQDKNKTIEKDIEANYTLETTIELNNNYTYMPYKIKSFNVNLKDGEEDFITRLIKEEIE